MICEFFNTWIKIAESFLILNFSFKSRWGNTVNVASRMESTGKAGCIQVVEETKNILEEFGYIFEQRGLVSVKGKGQLMTYYLVGKKSANNSACSTASVGSSSPV